MLAEPRTTGVAARIRTRAARRAGLSMIGPDTWLVAAITAVAAVLRFATITSQSFWVDEAATVHEVGLSFGQMLHELRINETTPPLYFALAWLWTRVFGTGELAIRSLSAVCGVLLIAVIYLCGRELVSRAAGVVAAAFAAFSPFMIWYSQEARSYMLFALLSAVSLLCTARALRTRSRADLALWAISSALAVLTHFFAFFLVAPEAVWLLWRRRERGTVVACAAVAAVQLAVLPLALGDTSHPLSWIVAGGGSLSSRVNATPVDFAVSTVDKNIDWLTSHGLLDTAVVAAMVALVVWRWGGRRERRGAALAGAFGVLVVLIPIGLAWLGHDYVYNRNFIAAWVPLAVALAAACTAPRARVAGGALAALVIGVFIWANATIDSSPALQRRDWRAAATALGHATGPRLILAEDGNDAEQPLSIYLPGTTFSYLGQPTSKPPVRVGEVDVVGNPWLAGYLVARLPAGVRLISARVPAYGIEVWRFALQPAWNLSEDAITAKVQALFTLTPTETPSVLIQR